MNSSLLKLFGLVVMAIVLSGCVAEKVARKKALLVAETLHSLERVAAQPVCCASYRDMDFELLTINVDQEVFLTTSSPTYEFDFGKSRFRSYLLPPLRAGDAVRVTAVEIVSGGSLIFRPVAIFMTEGFETIDLPSPMVFDDRVMKWSYDGHAADIRIQGALEKAKYMVVAADPSFFGKSYIRGNASMMMPIGTGAVSIPLQGAEFPYGFEGKAVVAIRRAAQ